MEKLRSTNPARGYEVIGEIEVTTPEEIAKAVNAAKKAFASWSRLPVEERVVYYEKLIKVYKKRADEIAEMQTKEVGKPITKQRGC